MKRLLIIALAVMMGVSSCVDNTYRDKVRQSVVISSGNRYLKTMVRYQGNVMFLKFDNISDIPTDSILAITTIRYNESNELLDGLVKLNTK